jgi:aminopeptidase N
MLRRVAGLAAASIRAAFGAGDAKGGDRRGTEDPYVPLDGDGGCDVERYNLHLRYDPTVELLSGVVTIEAHATRTLSRFDLDLEWMAVRSITVEGKAATWTREDGKLVVTPEGRLHARHHFTTVIAYDGVREPIQVALGISGGPGA